MKKGLKQWHRPRSNWHRPRVGRIDLMKKGLKLTILQLNFICRHKLEGLTWWRRDWNRSTRVRGIVELLSWKDWPDEEGIETLPSWGFSSIVLIVGRIDLMKKGLKQKPGSPSQPNHPDVGRIDLMKKGLKLFTGGGPVASHFFGWKDWPDEEGIETSWRPEMDFILFSLEGLTWWRRDWNGSAEHNFHCGPPLLEGLTWWRRDWNVLHNKNEPSPHLLVGRIDLMKKGLKRFSLWLRWRLFRFVGRIDLMKKGLKL